MLHEVSQSQKDQYRTSPLKQEAGAVRFTETQSRVVGTRGWGLGTGS